ncbi:MAG: TAXI family TRAP transporter solute-binding subunit [Campylobacterota bacterium]
MKKSFVSMAVSAALAVSAAAVEFVTIGTGGVTGVYYPTGGAICRLANEKRSQTGIRCSVESTGGSVYNVNTINAGELDFGIAQSDVVYRAYNGEGNFEGKNIKDLRTVMTIHPEPLTFVVSRESGIKKLADMQGKAINIGNPGSGQRNMVEMLFRETPLEKSMLGQAQELKAAEMPRALKDGKIDGYFYTVGHPSANIKEAANSVAIDIVDITPKNAEGIDAILEKMPYYAIGTIPAGTYQGLEGERKTIGVKATLVTSAKVSDEKVRAVIDAILGNFEKFKSMHPAYKGLSKQSIQEGLGAPLHDAAKAYYEEKGLL